MPKINTGDLEIGSRLVLHINDKKVIVLDIVCEVYFIAMYTDGTVRQHHANDIMYNLGRMDITDEFESIISKI
jgi:hypothetical protein